MGRSIFGNLEKVEGLSDRFEIRRICLGISYDAKFLETESNNNGVVKNIGN